MAENRVKVVIVTGSGSGIGQATVVEFAKGGYNVVMTGRTRSKLETTAAMCKTEGLTDDNMLLVVGDVSEPEDNERVITETLAKYNRMDVLVNNAGHSGCMGLFSEYPLDVLDQLYKVHIRGMFDLTQKAMPHLLKTKGSILNVSSVAATMPVVSFVGYGMLKASMDHFTRAVSVDYAPRGVRINTVNPSIVRTNIQDNNVPPDQLDAWFESVGKATPIGKCQQPRDTARVILFLASDDASFITGANVPVDGAFRNTMALPQTDDGTGSK